MQIINLNNIKRTEGVIYYRRQYTAEAELQMPNRIESLAVNFTIETDPIGNKLFEIDFDPNTISYPLLPLKKALKEFILIKDNNGELPI
ncbi:MAG: hypothetical protein J6B81_01685 [Spirochaetaceae bacterium]|nr:hypothetical protein [Spirochaetaceae bacterium]